MLGMPFTHGIEFGHGNLLNIHLHPQSHNRTPESNDNAMNPKLPTLLEGNNLKFEGILAQDLHYFDDVIDQVFRRVHDFQNDPGHKSEADWAFVWNQLLSASEDYCKRRGFFIDGNAHPPSDHDAGGNASGESAPGTGPCHDHHTEAGDRTSGKSELQDNESSDTTKVSSSEDNKSLPNCQDLLLDGLQEPISGWDFKGQKATEQEPALRKPAELWRFGDTLLYPS